MRKKSHSCEFIVGTYAERTEESILCYEVDFSKEIFEKKFGIKGLCNPSYLTVDREKGMLYAVEEMEPEGLLATLKQRNGQWELVEEQTTKGADPCHVRMDDGKKLLTVTNYSSRASKGSWCLYRLDEKACPQLTDFIQCEGSGTRPDRQRGPHIHGGYISENQVLVCDFGADLLRRYKWDKEQGIVKETGGDLHFPGGTGPRHLCFAPDDSSWIYLVGELDACVWVYHLEDGSYVHKQTIDSLEEGTTEEARRENRAAAIKMTEDGGYLFVCNRGDDSITAFVIEEDRSLRKVDCCKTGSREPRDLEIFEDYILVGHQQGKCITALRFERHTGKLCRLSMRLEMEAAPVCIVNVAMC